MAKFQLYTDGACRSCNLGAYAYAVIQEGKLVKDFSHIVDKSTNNRMELTAVIQGLKQFNPDEDVVEVLSDSCYVVNCFLQRWYIGWQKRGWKNSAGDPVKNSDLWLELFAIVNTFRIHPTWKHVKGHSGNKWNEHCDTLCSIQYNNSGIGGIINV